MKCTKCGADVELLPCPLCRSPRLLALGQLVFGQYTVTGFIGEGAMGEVYQATDGLGAVVAIKLVKPASQADLAQLLNEGKLAHTIRHSNVCQTLALCMPTGDCSFHALVQEYIPGHRLSDRISANDLVAEERLLLGIGLADGLGAIHRAGVIHRDLKPANIIVREYGLPVIIDFGVARSWERAAETIVVAGTPGYLATELWEGVKATRASDMYALGVIFLELFSSTNPFAGGTLVEIGQRHRDLDISQDKWPEIPSGILAIIVNLLNKDPKHRLRDAEAVASQLRNMSKSRAPGVPASTWRPPDETRFPFGNPDGLEEDDSTLARHFIAFDGSFQDLRATPGDYRAQLWIGRKGSGKTVYLKMLQRHAQADPNVRVYGYESKALDTATVQTVGQLFDTERVGIWRTVWTKAILAFAAIRLLDEDNRSPGFLGVRHREALARECELLGLKDIHRTTVCHEVRSMLVEHGGNARVLSVYLQRSHWTDLEECVIDALHETPPILVFLDGLDELSDDAPRDWLACQEGLYWAIRDTLTTGLKGRLRVYAALRDWVMRSVLAHEDFRKHEKSGGARRLIWDRDAIKYFLERKLSDLDPYWFVANTASNRGLLDWLGSAQISVPKRGGQLEDLDKYLLRHTRMLPRDLVELGNALCLTVAACRGKANSSLDDVIRKTVATLGERVGRELIRTCAIQIAAHLGGGSHEPDASMAKWVTDQLIVMLRSLRERFSRAGLRKLDKRATEKFNTGQRLSAVLWFNGVLGAILGGRRRFYSEARPDEGLPDSQEYVFHPALIDAVGIESVGTDVE